MHRLGRNLLRLAAPATRALWLLASSGPEQASAAIELLRVAAEQRPGDPGLWIDLGAAYSVRAARDGDGLDWIDALEAFETALELDPSSSEALFNRALLFERLGLGFEAVPAWERYAELETDPGWRSRALVHLQKLRRAAGSDREPLPEALEGSDPAAFETALEQAVRERPAEVRRLGIESWLPAWAEAWGTGNRAGASELLERLERAGSALRARNGDEALGRMAEALRRTDSAGTGGADRLAAALRDYRSGLD